MKKNAFVNIIVLSVSSMIILSTVFCMDRWLYHRFNLTKDNIIIKSAQVDLNDKLAWSLTPNNKGTEFHAVNGELVYKSNYSTDEFGRRTTVDLNPEIEGRTAVLFFGCSFTFGMGVEDNENLPSQFAMLSSKKYHVYNYGVNGYGTSHMYIQSEDIGLQIEEMEVIVVYVLYKDHLMRSIGGMSVFTTFGKHLPYIDYDLNGELRHFGNFDTDRSPLINDVYSLLSKSGIVQTRHLRFPVMNQHHYGLYKDLISQTKERIEAQKTLKKFYILAYPDSALHTKKELNKLIEASKEIDSVTVLDYSNLFDTRAEGYCLNLRYDNHPSPLSYKLVSEQLYEDIVKE